ncbi:MAG: primase [Phycisphaerales bacterium]|nr:primase [Phycisphaerales bacterium]
MASSNAGNDLGEFKSQVLAAVDIVVLIGQNVALKRRGKDYVGLCPFHSEKSPSFSVNPAKQFFYCYGCKAGGDALSFVMKRDRVEFIDALRTVGESVGLEMPKAGGTQKSGERQTILDMHSAAGAFFQRLLEHPQHGVAAREYLQKRKIDAESVTRFQIGYAADAWDGLLRGPVGRKFAPQQLRDGGLVKEREKGTGFYDTFRNRLMFPIRDESGRVIAFGGRVMPGSEDPAKYLNSPETPLFSKSRSIFGIDLARQKIVERRTAVVVEGYTDVVVAHQFGVSNVVSILGTAMTEQHVNLLRRFADKIVLLFDADTAGDTAVDRAVGLFLTQPVDIAIASMPEGVDPDEFLLEHGAAGFEQVVSSATDALLYKWKQLVRRFNDNGDSLTGQQKAVEEYMEMLAGARGSGPVDAIRWGRALAQVSRLTEIPVDQLNRRFRAVKQVGPRLSAPAPDGSAHAGPAGQPTTGDRAAPKVQRALTAQERAERQLLGVLLLEPKRWFSVQKALTLPAFTDELHHRLAEIYWTNQQDEGEPVFHEFLGLLKDDALRELAVACVDEVEALGDTEAVFNSALNFVRETYIRKLPGDTERNSLGPQDDALLLKQLSELARQPNLRRA